MKKLVTLACLAIVSVVLAASPKGAKKEPVAEGFADWEGIDDKNYIYGRQISPSDLRHRVVVVVHLDANALRSGFISTSWLLSNIGMPVSHMVVWDTMEIFPRACIPLAVIHGECDAKKYSDALKAPKGKEVPEAESSAISYWSRGTYAAVYGENAKLVGADVPTQFPYVQIVMPSSPEVAFKGEYNAKTASKANKEIRKLIKKGTEETSTWRPLYGVSEVKYWTKVEKKIKDGKPAQSVFAELRAGIKDKDADKAKEAQIMFDALMQYKSDLIIRIQSEFTAAPARAIVDFQSLVKYFPSEKKKLQAIDQKLKQSKSAQTIGKMFDCYFRWNDPTFTFKNTSEAKKAAQMVAGWKKQIDIIAQDQSNAALAGEAALIGSFLDGYADVLMTKVPQK